MRLRKVSCAQLKGGSYLSGRADRELSLHGVQEQGTEGFERSRRVSSSLKSWKYTATFFSKTSGCFFIMHTLCACIPAALTRQTITTLKELLLSLPSIKCELRQVYATASNGSKGEKVGKMIWAVGPLTSI